ncbi:MAG: extracellular solute-binding protein [Treponema sp.]|nr:extracellular solute-binding protein [Treponema sp.]
MKMPKFLCLFAAAVLLLPAAVFAGGGSQSPAQQGGSSAPSASAVKVNPTGFPIVNDPITMSVFGCRDQNQANWSDMFFFKEYEKMTNIHLDLQEVPAQGFEERKNLLFASNELPDIFVKPLINQVQFTMYGSTSKQLIPLDPYLQQWAPNINNIIQTNEAVRISQTAADGHVYVLPQLDFSNTGHMGFMQWINKTWLAKLNLKIPTTPDEFRQVLVAFRDKDPNGNGIADEIPLGIREIAAVYVLGGSWGLQHQMNDTINVNNGKVHFWIKDDTFKAYIQYLSGLYADKLLWQNYYKADSRPEWRSNLANALFGAFYMPYSDVFINVENQFEGFPPLVGPYGDQVWSASNDGITAVGAFAISNVCKYPEAALRWVDYFYTDEGSIFYRYGIEGQTFHFDAKGNAVINDNILNAPEGFMTALGKINLVPGGGGPHLITNKTDGIVASDLTKSIAADLAPYLPKVNYGRPPLNENDQERANAILQDLNKYRDESVTKFIVGDWSFDRWDEYCRTLDQIGLPELEAIYQKAFDASHR